MTNQTYQVPVVPPDLRREETIKQLCDSLEYLESVCNDVFTRISARVGENKGRLQSIQKRVDLAQAKVDKLKGSNKATKVFSSAKYPGSECQEKYESVYATCEKIQDYKAPAYKLQSRHQVTDDKALKEKLQFYNVHLNLKRSKHEDESSGEGLGRLPRNIPSVGSLLLFNTAENPYKKYVMLDPLGVITKTRQVDIDQDDGLADAPSTITEREELQRIQKENIFYTPSAGEVPEIAVPDFLPDLLGVADDLSYTADLGPGIAPSLPADLPSLVPEIETIPSGPADESSMPPPPPPGPPPPEPPPPPGPPPPVAPPPPPVGPPQVPHEAPKAPPPPPVSEPQEAARSSTPTPASGEDDGRADLLAAIRNAGGAGKAKLKNVKHRKIENKKKKQEEKDIGGSTGGGDLMSDLFAKLAMRRKGISGPKGQGGATNKESEVPSNSLMSSIPPLPMDQTDSATNEEWE